MDIEKLKVETFNLPDKEVIAFIDSVDSDGKRTYRHIPSGENEIQYFASIDGVIVGYGHIMKHSLEPTFGNVVHQSVRGTGVGKKMYAHMVDLARKLELTAIIGEQDVGNFAAHKRCLVLGFKFHGPEEGPDGKWIFRLRKEL